MIEHVWSLICTNSIVDQETNNITLNSVIEQITVFAEPTLGGVLPIQFDLVTTWIRKFDDTPTEGISRIRFKHPSGKITFTEELSIDLLNIPRMRRIIHLTNLLLEEPGRHTFLVELKDKNSDNWEEVAAIPLAINFSPIQENESKKKKSVRKSTKKEKMP